MECVHCGTELRPTARFCNKCGTAQPLEPQPSNATDSVGSAGSSGERIKRPPRIPRVLDEDAAGIATAQADTPAAPAMEESPPRARSRAPNTTALSEHMPPTVADAREEAEATAGTAPSARDEWADQETIEAQTVLPAASVASAPRVTAAPMGSPEDSVTPTGMPSLAELVKRAPGDAQQLAYVAGATGIPANGQAGSLPWPLPPSIIVGGRYRVASLESPAASEAEENVYTVHDLQGYERCWSCGAEYGDEVPGERYCRQCGADMLARDYLMYERLVIPSQPETSDTSDGGPHTADATKTAANADERVFVQGTRSYRLVPKVVEGPTFPRGVHLVYGAASDVGASRPGEHNEDSLGVLTLGLAHDSRVTPLLLAIVADGLGGHVGGQDASRLVVRTVVEYIAQNVALPVAGDRSAVPAGEQLKATLVEATGKANVALCQLNADHGVDMGSTLVAALLADETAYIANAGDSRAYVFDGQELRRVTTDHSLVEQLIAGGLIAPEARYSHPQRNQIFRSLGDEPGLPVDIFEQRLTPGMRLVLCSDGLWEMVRDEELASILQASPHPQDACDALIRAANAHGGEDNIAVIVLEARA